MPPVFSPNSHILSAARSQRFHHQVAQAASVEDCRALMRSAPKHLKLLPFGAGLSLGDSCLNADGGLIVTRGMAQILGFDRTTGVLTSEPGLAIGTLAKRALSADNDKVWFPAVYPGSTAITVAGAIANDIHGKNHATQGSFCHHVQALTLLRSDGDLVTCSERENAGLFHATLGGIGLTGIIVSASLQMRTVSSPVLEREDLYCETLAEAIARFFQSARDWEYSYSWFDPFDPTGRGVFTRARHCKERTQDAEPLDWLLRAIARLPVPAAIATPAIWRAWYAALLARAPHRRHRYMTYDGTLAPLDKFRRWNYLFGSRGLLHLQCTFPDCDVERLLDTLLAECRRAGEVPYISSIKHFGARPPAGLLSFPREGFTAALDFANRGASTRQLLRRLEAIVVEAGGALYPGKDSTLSPEGFRRSFPAWESFAAHVDPRFSSSFWRRVTSCE
jgi:FAD/FMN-containing dehydrogenase